MTFTARSALLHLGYHRLIVDEILNLYNLPYRKYHNEQHLDAMLRWVDTNTPNLEIVLKNIIFHDCVYSDQLVPPGFNEAASIVTYAALEENPTVALIVAQGINATAYHERDQDFLLPTSKLLLDLDLQSFAQDETSFRSDSYHVWEEYSTRVPKKTFEKYNKLLLKKLLKRKQIYYIKTEWEDAARGNLESKIKNFWG